MVEGESSRIEEGSSYWGADTDDQWAAVQIEGSLRDQLIALALRLAVAICLLPLVLVLTAVTAMVALVCWVVSAVEWVAHQLASGAKSRDLSALHNCMTRRRF